MKKLLLGLFTGISALGVAQNYIPNGGFENWTVDSVRSCPPWHSSNENYISNFGFMDPAFITVTEVPGQTGPGIRLETKLFGSDTINAYITNSPGDPFQGVGGVPVSVSMPNALTGHFRYNTVNNDTALLIVLCKVGGNVISMDMMKIAGNQPAWTAFNMPLNLMFPPDSIIIAATCSNLITEQGVEPGSFLELDELGMTNGAQTQLIEGGTFSPWVIMQMPRLLDWRTAGYTQADSIPHSGSYAIGMMTTPDGGSWTRPGYLFNGTPTDSGVVGGIPYNGTNDTIAGWYRYYPAPAGDTAAIWVNLKANGVSVGGTYQQFTAQNNYTYFEYALPVGATPDTMMIFLQSTAGMSDSTKVGSYLVIDDLHLKSNPVGIKKNNFLAGIKTYPNPASNNLFFLLNGAKKAVVTVYDLAGKKVLSADMSNANDKEAYRMDIQQLPQGTYLFEVVSEGQKSTGTFVKQ